MALRRTIHCKIGLCEELAACSDLAQLAFTWGIIHCDDWGTIHGAPRRFRAEVFPMRETLDLGVLEAALDELVNAGLVRRYSVEGTVYLHYPTFDTHQEGLHKRTEKHRLPPPGKANTQAELPDSSGKFRETPSEVEVEVEVEVKGSETKGSKGLAPPAIAEDAQVKPPAEVKPANSPRAQLVQDVWAALGFTGSPPSKKPAAFSGAMRLMDGKAAVVSDELIPWIALNDPSPGDGDTDAGWFLAFLKEKLACPPGVGWRQGTSSATSPPKKPIREIDFEGMIQPRRQPEP